MKKAILLSLTLVGFALVGNANATPINLICTGGGTVIHSRDSQDYNAATNSFTHNYSSQAVPLRATIYLIIDGQNSTIKLPKILAPTNPNPFSKDKVWWGFDRYTETDSNILAHVKSPLGGFDPTQLNIDLDRLTGGLSINGDEFNGVCETYDPAMVKNKF